MPRESITALGWALTATIWLLAGLMMLSTVAGECLPETGATCPTGGERTMMLVWIAAGAAALNALAAGLVVYLRRRG